MCMSAPEEGKLKFIYSILHQYEYIDILKKKLLPSTDQMGQLNNFIFQQGNDPKRTAHNWKLWLQYNVVKQLPTPPQSTNLNPNEHL